MKPNSLRLVRADAISYGASPEWLAWYSAEMAAQKTTDPLGLLENGTLYIDGRKGLLRMLSTAESRESVLWAIERGLLPHPRYIVD